MPTCKSRSAVRAAISGCAVLLIAGCGGSGGSNGADTGSLTLSLTDAAADTAERIVLEITGVTVKPRGGSQEVITLDPAISVDLLALTDGTVATLLDEREMIAGEYEWLRLEVDESLSYVEPSSGGMVDVRIPSARGLQLSSGFVITVDGNTEFVIDWDARQGLTDPQGQEGFILRPSLRIIDMATYGSILGTVADGLTMDGCENDPATDAGNAVYVYSGADVIPDDIDNNEPNPLVTAPVRLQSDGSYGYQVHYVPPGDYTVAFTCQGLADSVPVDEADPLDGDDMIEFIDPQNAVVVDDQDTVIDFPAR